MASLLPKNGEIFSYSATAPSPSKDYCQLVVTVNEFIFRTWRISLRNDSHIHPKEERDTHEDFLYDDRMQSEILRVLGKSVLNYAKAVARGQIDYLPRLPEKILLKIFNYLELEDIDNLTKTNRFFDSICNLEDTWKNLFQRHTEAISPDIESLASKLGWKKIFFTNKLQLQLLLRRQRDDTLNQADEKQANKSTKLETVSENTVDFHPSYEQSTLITTNKRGLSHDESIEIDNTENNEKTDNLTDSQIDIRSMTETPNTDINIDNIQRDILSPSGIVID
ncbi:DgyrCDS529 [Dimorphilus gyrociliatus]|uniref:DgyrCDS529 n=1 Tax=Dimorphilus gyrociliatus TaxID=2664684 RepID=A0A7I8V4X1_9ANNE|nr:DgyrCDS529 [Dimorphilus gyrociliatus]